MKGYVTQIQPFSVNDGEGIRSTIFLAGCPLRCKWCSNPEGWAQNESVLTDARDVLAQIQKHRLFYAYSGGGVTFSGGEPTAQPEFLEYLSSEIYDMGYSMSIETCGMFEFDELRSVLERMDLIFMDLKLMDPEKHRDFIGASNVTVLRNIANLPKLAHTDKVIRIPVIKGVNADDENIRSSAAYVKRVLPEANMELLPYHSLGTVKYKKLGIQYDHPEFSTPTAAEMERLRDIVRSEGVSLADYR